MKIKVVATVVFPIYINQEIEVAENSPEAIRSATLELADRYLEQGSSSPFITESNTHPELAE